MAVSLGWALKHWLPVQALQSAGLQWPGAEAPGMKLAWLLASGSGEAVLGSSGLAPFGASGSWLVALAPIASECSYSGRSQPAMDKATKI